MRFMRIWVQTIIPPVVMVALYFIIFGNLIGQRIGEMDGMRLHGFHHARTGHDVDHHQFL